MRWWEAFGDWLYRTPDYEAAAWGAISGMVGGGLGILVYRVINLLMA